MSGWNCDSDIEYCQRRGHICARLISLSRVQQQHQDGSGHRGLLTHRVRVQQVKVPFEGRDHRQDLFPAR